MTNETDALNNASVVMTVKLGAAAAGNDAGELMLDAAPDRCVDRSGAGTRNGTEPGEHHGATIAGHTMRNRRVIEALELEVLRLSDLVEHQEKKITELKRQKMLWIKAAVQIAREQNKRTGQ